MARVYKRYMIVVRDDYCAELAKKLVNREVSLYRFSRECGYKDISREELLLSSIVISHPMYPSIAGYIHRRYKDMMRLREL